MFYATVLTWPVIIYFTLVKLLVFSKPLFLRRVFMRMN